MTNLLKFLLAAAVTLGISNAVYADELIDGHIPIGNPEALEGTTIADNFVYYLADVKNTNFQEFHISLEAKDEELKDEFPGHIYVKPYELRSNNPAGIKNNKWNDERNTLKKVLIFHDKMSPKDPLYSPLYSIAVHDTAAHKFEIGFKSFACQNSDCGGPESGKCNNGKCECIKDEYNWAGSMHCARPILRNLEFGSDPLKVQIPPSSSKAFHFKGSQENFAEVILSVERTSKNGKLYIYGLQTKPEDDYPTESKHHFSETITPGYTKTQISIPAILAKQDFVIILVADPTSSDVTISTKLNACPNNCTSADNGTCNEDTQRCKCKEGYFADDCSFQAQTLTNKVLQVEIPEKGSKNFIVELNDSHSSRYVQLALTIDSVTGKADDTVYLPRAFIDEGKAPNEHQYKYTSALPLSQFQRIPMPTSGLGVPKFFITTVNPTSAGVSKFKISLSTDITCPNGCSGNGVCNDHGICECKKGFLGADCSVEVETGTLHWAIVVVIGFIALLVGAFINHFFIRKPAAPEDSSNNYAELQA